MRRRHGNRARLGGALLAALGALALLALPSVAAAKDRNNDRIPDRWEKRHHLSLQVKQTARDQDRDHLDNRGEFQAGNDPRDSDSDNDGVTDGNENAGTIASYDPTTGRLVITLFGGDTVSGTVTEETQIKCGHDCQGGHDDGEDSSAAASHNDGEHSAPNDEGNSGPGSGPPGQGDDENDDPPGHDGTPPGASEGPGHGADNSADCTAAALVVGAVVEEADLSLENGVATFTDIELAGPDSGAGDS
jgi:hypothetical protein